MKKAKTVTSINGQDICKRFNDQRGCKPNCPQGKLHLCDILLASNKACGGTHTRSQHDPKRHGVPQTQ
eukprot:3871199-Karenia_brevis.AAC.1